MKRSFTFIALILLIATGSWLLLRGGMRALDKETPPTPEPETSSRAATTVPPTSAPSLAASAKVDTAAEASTEQVIKNGKALASLLHDFIQPRRTMDELLENLRTSRQEPFLMRNQNEATGEMTIVRTKSPLPGTRYFHAQYFAGEGGADRFLQHMSFELPGHDPQAWQRAAGILASAFPGLGAPSIANNQFMQWDIDDGYTLWMRRLDSGDLANNPNNAYTAADVGTIQVAVELNPEVD